MMFTKLSEVKTLATRAARPGATDLDRANLAVAKETRANERGPSKLARRLTRKNARGQLGSF